MPYVLCKHGNRDKVLDVRDYVTLFFERSLYVSNLK
jgi:hypothetical protein